uniref:AWS domain-containing protein n=1 Tax=Panagrellus redivivus TaxID=6233 RepID=A0A7E4V148_PANRE
MNLYFGIRVVSYLISIVGAFLITFSIWSVFYSWSASYHHYLDLPSNFFQVLIANGIKCSKDMSAWSEWADCGFDMTTTTRTRISAACKEVTDSKPCVCPVEGYCKGRIVKAGQSLDVDCMEKLLSSFNDTNNKAFIVSGSKRRGRCKLLAT